MRAYQLIRELSNEDVERTVQQTKRLDDIKIQIGVVQSMLDDIDRFFRHDVILQDIKTACKSMLEQKRDELTQEYVTIVTVMEKGA